MPEQDNMYMYTQPQQPQYDTQPQPQYDTASSTQPDVNSQYQQAYATPQPQYQYQYTQDTPYTQVNVNVSGPQTKSVLYPMTETDKTLRLVAFIFMVLSLIGTCWLIVPLAWMIPMTVISWGIYQGTKANTVAFGVCTLLFASIVAGVLLLVSTKNEKIIQ